MDSKVLRAGIYSATLALIVGAIFGNFGGWSAFFTLTDNVIGTWIFAVIFSTIAGFVYVTWFANFLPGTIIIKGALYGTLIWVGFLILGGVSSFFRDLVYQNDSIEVLFVSLVLHWIWGSSFSLFLNEKGLR